MALSEEQMIELVRRVYADFNRGHFDAVAARAHPEVVLARPGHQPELRGVEALRAWMEPDAFESQVVEPLAYRGTGNRLLVELRSTNRGAGSGIEMEIRAWTVWTFDDDGKITRSEIFLEHEEAEALEALDGD